jgi:hypothetical protein
MTPIGTPDPRYFKDANGLRPRWRLFFVSPREYLWRMQPQWFVLWRCYWRDRHLRRLMKDLSIIEQKRAAWTRDHTGKSR